MQCVGFPPEAVGVRAHGVRPRGNPEGLPQKKNLAFVENVKFFNDRFEGSQLSSYVGKLSQHFISVNVERINLGVQKFYRVKIKNNELSFIIGQFMIVETREFIILKFDFIEHNLPP